MLVRDVMSSPAVTVTRYTTVREAVRLLDEYRITALPVVDDDGAVVGVISEADLIVLPPDGPVRRVAESMSQPAVTVPADADLADAVELLVARSLKSLPVVVRGRIAGVVSRSDLVHALAHADDLIRRAVLGALRAEEHGWRVEVTNGVVRLTGPVTSRQCRDAEALARSVDGVVAVRIG